MRNADMGLACVPGPPNVALWLRLRGAVRGWQPRNVCRAQPHVCVVHVTRCPDAVCVPRLRLQRPKPVPGLLSMFVR